MKNRGFTLLELLGVIVILALLTTLVFPSVLNVIKKSSDQTDDLSMQLISNAADLYIDNKANEFIKFNGNKYVIEIENLLDEGNIPSNTKISGIDNIEDKCIQVTYQDGFNYELKEKGTCEKLVQFDSICKMASDSTVKGVKAGAKYNCKVNPNKNAYTFYVLTTPDDNTIDLIMDQNINSDGTPAGMIGVRKSENAEKYNLVEWNSNWNNERGPIGAITFLYDATKEWINVSPLNYFYNDREYQGITSEEIGYVTFEAKDGIATITQLSGDKVVIGKETQQLRARLPIYSGVWNSDGTVKISEKGDVADKTTTNSYLYENLEANNIWAYWTLSSSYETYFYAWLVSSGGVVSRDVDLDNFGVRPVITLPITNSEMIPDEYQAVEYIAGQQNDTLGTRTAGIDLNYLWKDVGRINLSMQFLNLSDDQYGSMIFKTINEGISISPYICSRTNEIELNGITGSVLINYTKEQLTNNGFKEIDISIDDNTINNNIYFGSWNDGAYSKNWKLEYLLLYNTEYKLVRKMLPCYRKSDGEVGMYDLVEDKFYTNSGTGTFTKGQDI